MARFYGTVKGGRGEAARLGHATTGLHVTAQSCSGDIRVDLFDENGEDCVWIVACEHGGGLRKWKEIYRGPIKQLLDQSWRKTMLTALVGDMLTGAAA